MNSLQGGVEYCGSRNRGSRYNALDGRVLYMCESVTQNKRSTVAKNASLSALGQQTAETSPYKMLLSLP